MMALIGASLFGAFVLQDIRIHPELGLQDLPWGLILRYSAAMTLGGALIGYLFCGLFGRTGAGGWVLALFGGVLAASLSGLIGSVFGLMPDLLADGFSTSDAIRIGVGLLVFPLASLEQPILFPLVMSMIIASHIWSKRARNDANVTQ